MEYNSVYIGIHSQGSQNILSTNNSIQIILPFELEKIFLPKRTTTLLSTKLAEEA